MKLAYILLCFCVVWGSSNAVRGMKRPKQKYCRVAVLEMKQYDNKLSSEEELIKKNLEKYEAAASVAKSNNASIIILPEKAMFPMKMLNPTWFLKYAEDIPHGSKKANPCNDKKFSNRTILRNLSCIAKKNKLFVVATLIDVKKCKAKNNCEKDKDKNSCVAHKSDCPLTGKFKFNTLVVFNKKGVLVARYYKRHPFVPLETSLITTPKYPESAYFKAGSCGYTVDIGFDFLFNNSFIDFQKYPETSAVAYANWWFDHTPHAYGAISNQQAWCLANNVTVLSSDVHAPNLGSLGSGIYIPGIGAVVHTYNPDGKSKLLISNIPASKSRTNLDKKSLNPKFLYLGDDNSVSELNGEEPRDFKEVCAENVLGMNPVSSNDYRCKQTEVEQYTFVKLKKTEDHIRACSNNFCCSLDYKAESMNENFYFLVSGKRLNFYGFLRFGVESCILARCEPVLGQPCRNFLLKSNTKFVSANITASFSTSHIYPHILESGPRFPDRNEWQFDGKSQISYQNSKGKNFLYMDMYGRPYERDGTINNPVFNTPVKV